MSIAAMNYVWNLPDSVPLTPTEAFVAIALADHADGDGECWPGIKRLAQKVRTSERTVQRCIRRLEELGIIERVDQGADAVRADRRPNLYRFPMSVIHSPVDNPPSRGDMGVTPKGPRGDTGDARGDTGDAHGVTPVSPEPSVITLNESSFPLATSFPKRERTKPPMELLRQKLGNWEGVTDVRA